MSNDTLLKRTKKVFKHYAHDYYQTREAEIESVNLPEHYFNLGYTISLIEESTTVMDLLNGIRMGRYDNVGLNDNDSVEWFIELLVKELGEK